MSVVEHPVTRGRHPIARPEAVRQDLIGEHRGREPFVRRDPRVEVRELGLEHRLPDAGAGHTPSPLAAREEEPERDGGHADQRRGSDGTLHVPGEALLPRLREPRAEQQAPGIEVVAPPPVIPDPSKPKTLRPFAKARGALLYPASGTLMRRYGENDELGVASKGLTFETRPGAQVVAPYDGRVLFAGPFKGYGQILIIEHSDGYHSLLAGLDRVESTAGQWLVAGEPVGVMPGGESKPRLYLELRHDGQPINPMPWLAPRDEKVSG